MLTSLLRPASAAALLAISTSLSLAAQETQPSGPTPPAAPAEAPQDPVEQDPGEQGPGKQGPGKQGSGKQGAEEQGAEEQGSGEQGSGPAPIANPSLEAGDVGGSPAGWRFSSQTGGAVALVDGDAAAGARSARIDASSAEGRGMSNLMQTIDAAPWRGERVRYRAAVRTAPLGDGVGAQLWCRVDRPKAKDGSVQLGAFDNMQDRPITADAWQRYDIVLDVADDATQIALGVFVLGKGKVWLDDVSLEAVDLTVATTGAARSASSRSRGYQMPAAVRAAMATAQDAPQQPFWTWWLALPALAAGLFVFGMWPRPRSAAPTAGDEAPLAASVAPPIGPLRAFALRFTVCYWLLYCLPGPFSRICSALGSLLDRGAALEPMSFLEGWSRPLFWTSGKLSVWHRDLESWMAHRTGDWFFGIEGELVPPNGSGDTTMGYLVVLDWFVLAFALAAVWTLLLRRRAVRRDAAVDLTRSYLRYVLAFAMLGYGLAKVNMARNQFPEVSELRLDRTWGETSPMGLVWGFMGASRPYTIFAGLGEVVAAFFLLWRHTALLGAVVAVAVMTNVVMLNYCYDVPVKIYSTHLTLMGLLILVPDARRLLALLMGNRNPTDPGTPN
ncbi:MAG: hypothetical protein ACON4Z_05890, partial [Planctomycetota bacterium]